ncbi:MAG: hypothetical protein EOO87_01305 [Pedobacter sp.]|nr:MAG: hypothetical protein EOO87_01305 [Pedobacter sp.]
MKGIRNSIFAGIILGVFIGIYLAFNMQTNVAVVIGVFCAVVSPILFYVKIFSKIDYTIKFEKINPSLIIYSGLANHFKNQIAVGGTLYLLNDKLIFQSNGINFTHRHEHIIYLNQISEIDFFDTIGFVSNGLSVKTNNKREQFVVNKREVWKEQIENISPALRNLH